MHGAAQPGLTERIITASSKERPADAVLREEFRAQRDMMPSDIAAVSRTVFNYFRWRGWLDLGNARHCQGSS